MIVTDSVQRAREHQPGRCVARRWGGRAGAFRPDKRQEKEMRELVVDELGCVSGAGEYCGPEGGFLSNFIPDLIFRDSCKAHDQAYSRGVNKNQADSQFLSDMFDDVAASGNSLYYPVAVLYYVAVVLFGGMQYSSGSSSDDPDPAFANIG